MVIVVSGFERRKNTSRLLLSGTTLRSEGDLFLCGMTPAELSERLGVEVCFTEQDGGAFLEALLGL